MRQLLILLAGAGLLAAQQYHSYPRHNFTFGAGAASPRAELSGLFMDRPGISFAYGYRFERYFQADVGLDTVFGAANIRDYLETPFGPRRIRDYQFFIPVGGRGIIPLARGRLLFSGGGGGAYLRYAELLHQPSEYYNIDCPVCSTRSGWGYYGLVGVSAFVDRSQHFRIGVNSKVYRAHTKGDQLGSVPGVRTRDRWVNISARWGSAFEGDALTPDKPKLFLLHFGAGGGSGFWAPVLTNDHGLIGEEAAPAIGVVNQGHSGDGVDSWAALQLVSVAAFDALSQIPGDQARAGGTSLAPGGGTEFGQRGGVAAKVALVHDLGLMDVPDLVHGGCFPALHEELGNVDGRRASQEHDDGNDDQQLDDGEASTFAFHGRLLEDKLKPILHDPPYG